MFHTPVEEMLRRWLDHNACPLKPAIVEAIAGQPGTPDEAHSAIRRVYRPCREGVEVVLLPALGRRPRLARRRARLQCRSFSAPGTAVIDANTEMWKFFLALQALRLEQGRRYDGGR